MADMYSFSGFKLPALPELPEGCTHAVIYYDAEDGVYYLFCSSERIVYNENNVPQLPATTSWGGYACRAGGTYWFSATFTPEGDVENPDYYLLDQVLLWTNTDICQKDTDTVVLAATTPLQYPTITSISSSRSYTLGEEVETLICEASVNDGELSYQWYHGEETVGEGSSYTPDVSIVGSESYYCIVTNTVSGTQLTTTSRTITITVEEEVEKFSIVAYVSGMVARMCGRRTPYPYSAPVPVAYLYNGIRLPALPEWDREKYPYAYIMNKGSLILSASPVEYYVSTGFITLEYWRFHTNYLRYTATQKYWECKEWTLTDSVGDTEEIISFLIDAPTWCNTDIIKEDTVYLEASDAVPLYRGYVINDVEKAFTLTIYPFYREDTEAYPNAFVNYYSAVDAEYGFTDDFDLFQFQIGTLFQITFDGASRIYHLIKENNIAYLGNRHFDNAELYEDDGFPLYIQQYYAGNLGIETHISSATEGEFVMTIESLVTKL